jgi:hypothetical protein
MDAEKSSWLFWAKRKRQLRAAAKHESLKLLSLLYAL